MDRQLTGSMSVEAAREARERLDASTPRIMNASPDFQRRQVTQEVLPEGYSVSGTSKQAGYDMFSGASGAAMGGSGGGGSTLFQMQRPYFPEIDSPDRQQYPHDRRRANAIWRMFYRYDPVFSNAVEMYADMLVSDFDIVVPKDAGSGIKETLEYMCDRVKIVEVMRQIVIEYLVIGETFPHLFFSDDLGIWNYCGFHDPDYIDVKDAPLIRMDPILTFEPDEQLRKLLADTSPESQEIRKKFPTEFVQKVMARQPIRLAPTNVSHIARKLHPYDERGTSLASRLWRIWMVEDAVYQSTIQTFRRNACFVAGTKVLTSEGAKNIEDIKVNDKVISGEGIFQTVEAAWHEPADEIVEITTMGSENLECTPNHRFKMWARPRMCACGCGGELPNTSGGVRRSYLTGHYDFRRDSKTGRMTGDPAKWNTWSEQPPVKTLEGYDPIQTLNAEDIVKGDYLLVPRKFEEFPIEVNDETKAKARLLGYYVAEGSRARVTHKGREEYGLQWSFSLEEFDTWAEDVVQLGEGLGLNVYKAKEKLNQADDVRVGITAVYMRRQKDVPFASWCIKHAGMYSKHKRLSGEVMCWPLELKKELLIGMYRGDGHKDKRRQGAQYGTVSESLAYQVRIILAQLGVFGSVHRLEKGVENWSDCYSVTSNGEGGRFLRELVWGDADHYNKGYSHSWTWMDDDYIYVPVREVSARKEKTTVYNLTVSGDHSYIANGVATLNSPIRVCKLGDQASGWIPSPEKEAQFLQMLAQCENDPASVIVWNYGVQFEAWGTNERATTIRNELDTIEKVKMQALGLSKGMIAGETSFACSYDTIVRRADGSYSEIAEIQTGDFVADRHGKAKQVTAALKYPTPDKMVEIQLPGPRKLTVTENHELPVFTRPHECLCGCGADLGDEKHTAQGLLKWRSFSPGHHSRCLRGGRDRVWVDYKNHVATVVSFPSEHEPLKKLRADEIRAGDWLMLPRGFDPSDIPVTDETKAKARLLGYYVAEGSTELTASNSGNHITRFSFGRIDEEKEEFYTKDVAQILVDLGYSSTIRHSKKGDDLTLFTVYVPTSANEVSEYFEIHGGKGSRTKKLSSEVISWDLELKKELLRGMYRGDGYLYKKGIALNVVYNTSSAQLMRQVESLLIQLGYFPRINREEPRVDKKGYHHNECYMVTCSGKPAYALAEMIWGGVTPVWSELDWSEFNPTRGACTDVFVDEDYVYVPVKSVETIEADKEKHPHVYSLTVEDTHSYTLDNIASFNSAKSQLQVFLRRLLALRQYIETVWLQPKFFRPISEANDWVKATNTDDADSHTIKRTASAAIAEETQYIIPELKWKNQLDPQVDGDLLKAYEQLEKAFGIKLSKTKVCTAVGIDFEEEFEAELAEYKDMETKKQQILGPALDKKKKEEQGAKPGAGAAGAPGSGAKPPGADGDKNKTPDASHPPGSGGEQGTGALSESVEPAGGDTMVT